MTTSLAYSPCEPAFGCSEMEAKPVISASQVSNCWKRSWYPRVCSGGAKGWIRPNPFQVTGIISTVAFSFIVQEPSGIIEWTSERSRDSKRCMYRSIQCSEWYRLKTACAGYVLGRLNTG